MEITPRAGELLGGGGVVEERTQIVRPEEEGQDSLPEGQFQVADREEPPREPERAHDRSRMRGPTRDFHFLRHCVLLPSISRRPVVVRWIRLRLSNLSIVPGWLQDKRACLR